MAPVVPTRPPKKKEERRTTGISLPVALLERIDAIAASTNQSRNFVMISLLEAGLALHMGSGAPDDREETT